MNKLIIISFIFLQVCYCEILNVNINVCVDAERVDFSNSCSTHDIDCIEDINYLKSYRNFEDFYLHFKNKIYHSFENAVFFQSCELVTKISFPKTVYFCSTKYLPVTFIDKNGKNRSGLLSEYEVIKPDSVKDQAAKRHLEEKCGTEKLVFSLPNSIRNLMRIGTNLESILVPGKTKPYEATKDFFASYFKNNTMFEIFVDFFVIFLIIFIVFVLTLLSFCYICCCNCCSSNISGLLKKFLIEASDLESIIVQPLSQPAAQPAAQPVSQAVAQPVAQPVAQLVAQPVAQAAAQPVALPESKPVTRPLAQPETEKGLQPYKNTNTSGQELYWKLKRQCKERNLDTKGNIQQLMQRLNL